MKMKLYIIMFFVVASLKVTAQFSISWSTIDGGGGVMTGGAYAVRGTIGQHDG